MRPVTGAFLLGGLLAATTFVAAQPPGGGRKDGPKKDGLKSADGGDLVARMMAFDKNGDGKLTKDEVTDERLRRLFDRADANKDGVVTKEELTALAAKAAADDRGGPGGGGPGGRGPGGPGGPGGPQPGQVLPPFLQDMLNLTDDQKKQVADLQKEVDGRLGKILTDSQKTQLKEMRDRGPGRPGGGRPGEGGPGRDRP